MKGGHSLDMRVMHVVVIHSNQTHVTVVRQQVSTRSEVAITCPQHSVKHGFEEQEVAHPLGNDDVNTFERKLHVFHATFQQSDTIAQTVLPKIVKHKINSFRSFCKEM